LRLGQLAQLLHDRAQEAVQAGEREIRLCLDTRGAEDGVAGGALGGPRQQGRLADPRLTAQHERAALAARRSVQQPVDGGAFELTADQRAGYPLQPGRGHPPIVKAGKPSVQTDDATAEITDAAIQEAFVTYSGHERSGTRGHPARKSPRRTAFSNTAETPFVAL
jgi:hypothetical protein